MRDAEPLRRWLRVLMFRASPADFQALGRRDLVLGLLATWLVGIGRYWDDPGARLLQHLGLGSVVYVFALALLLWLIIWPLGPARWSYERVLTIVTLVSPPAALYAIPLERFVALEAARDVNAWFLAIVAAWRVALLFYFLRVSASLSLPRIVVGGLLPITFIVASLTVLNLERAVFEIMGGMRGPGTSNDTAYAILLLITFFSVWAFVPLLFAYIVQVATTDRSARATES